MSEWSERVVVLPGVSARAGHYDADFAPFQRGIDEAMEDPAIHDGCVQKPTQSGISLTFSRYAVKLIDTDPCAMGIVQPTDDALRDFFALKLVPMINASPELRRKVIQPRRGQAGGSTASRLMFPGGFLQGISASSVADAQSKTFEVVLVDEADELPLDLGDGGDTLAQLDARTRTAGHRRKFWVCGKPKLAKYSRIARLYQDSDQRKWFIPCQACGKDFLPSWSCVRWPEDQPHAALLHCPACEHGHNDHQRMAACLVGKWVITNPGPKRAGFHYPSWITPWVRDLGDLAAKFVAAKRAGPEQMQVWINSEAAETWNADGDQLDPNSLESRAEPYPVEPLPESVLVLTAAGDVQEDRVELEVAGWGLDRERWSVDYFVIRGDPETPELWAQVDAILLRRWQHPDGYSLSISAACIDSGGHHTQAVYRFCTPRAGRRVYAIKGRGGKVPIWPRIAKRRNIRERGQGHPVHIIGSDSAAEAVYHALRRPVPGPGFYHLPDRYPSELFAQLAAEDRILTAKGPTFVPRGSMPNEWWDLLKYNLAALEMLLVAGLDLERLAAVRASRVATQDRSTVPPAYASLPKGRRVRSAGLGG